MNRRQFLALCGLTAIAGGQLGLKLKETREPRLTATEVKMLQKKAIQLIEDDMRLCLQKAAEEHCRTMNKYVYPKPHETLDPGTSTAILFDTW